MKKKKKGAGKINNLNKTFQESILSQKAQRSNHWTTRKAKKAQNQDAEYQTIRGFSVIIASYPGFVLDCAFENYISPDVIL